MLTKTKYHPVIEELIRMIKANNWQDSFEKAIKKANSSNAPL